MKLRPLPPADARNVDDLLGALRERGPGFVPELRLREQTVDGALLGVFANFARTVLARFNQAPDKNQLAFFGALGIEPTPARAARTPIVFQLGEKASASAAAAGTAISAAPPPGSSEQVVFETERAVGLTAGRLSQIVSLWPGRDAYIDHSADYAAGASLRLFASAQLKLIDHVLYLAHEQLLALSGSTRLSLEWQLATPGSKALAIQWEYWDGQIWREFMELDPDCSAGVELLDSTLGLSQNGKLELRAEGAKSAITTVDGFASYWIRGRLLQSLPVDRGTRLPEVDAIRIASTVEQPFALVLRWRAEALHDRASSVLLRDEVGLPIVDARVVLTFAGDAATHELPLDDGEINLPAGKELSQLTSIKVTYFEVTATLLLEPHVSLIEPYGRLTVTLDVLGLVPDQVVGDGSKLDVSKPFYPFGQQPRPGAAFYVNSQEALSKPAGTLRLYLPLTSAPDNEVGSEGADRTPLQPNLAWEYWNGRSWAVLVRAPGSTADGSFLRSEVLDFVVPSDIESTTVGDTSARWIRARLLSGGFGYTQEVSWTTGGPTNRIAYVVHQAPVVAAIKLAYSWQYGPLHLERVLTYNDFQYQEHTDDARWPGSTFAPYQRVADETPALYLGFDQRPPSDVLGLFFDVREQPTADPPPEQLWEYWNGVAWQSLSVDDGTQHLRYPEIASFIAQGDSVALARFGRALHWVRVRSKLDGRPAQVVLEGLHPNSVWAAQQRTLRELAIGQSDGSPSQLFMLSQVPILPGERIEVRELFGPRAAVEWRLVALELFAGDRAILRALEDELAAEGRQGDIERGPLRLRRDRLKRVNEVWVQWQPRASLVGASADERSYALDRAVGSLRFGDGASGRLLAPGVAVQARMLQSGGGRSGNVPARTLTQLQAAVPGVESVFNPRAAEGGADGESREALSMRAPFSVRHRGRAIDLTDYATLAREASATVAYARALPTRTASGRSLPGWVTVIVIPHGMEAQPFPSVGLREQVEAFLAARAPAELASDRRVAVVGPDYLPVDVSATIAPRLIAEAGVVERAARAALQQFLHPLYGGPQGQGWELGRHVYLSDVAAVLERVPGLDYADDIALLSQGVPQGTELVVAADRIVVAGTLRLKVGV